MTSLFSNFFAAPRSRQELLGMRFMRAALALQGVAASWCWSASARACPDCAVGRAARAQVWLDDFALHLASAVLPFLVIVAVSRWADRIGRPAPEHSSHTEGKS